MMFMTERHTRRRVPTLAALVATLALVAASCGDDATGDDATGDDAVETELAVVSEEEIVDDADDDAADDHDADQGEADPDENEPDEVAAPVTTDAPTDPPQELTEVRVAYVQGFGSLPVHVAQTQGFFADHGLAVTETSGTDFVLWAQALDSQFDIVLSVGSVTLGATIAGLDLTVVSGLLRSDAEAGNNPIMTRDDDIESIEDLAGKRVGVLSLAGTVAESILWLVDEAGLDPNSVTLVPTPFPAMADQLNAGQLDAASAAIPFDAVLEQQGYRSIGDPVVAASTVITGSDESANAFFVSSRDFADGNPDVIEGWRAALDDAVSWIEADEEAARALLVDWLELPADVVEIATLPRYSVEVTAADFEVFRALGLARGSLTSDPDLAGLVWQP
jgi:NitT/TauT family transport system substrate-binding protein